MAFILKNNVLHLMSSMEKLSPGICENVYELGVMHVPQDFLKIIYILTKSIWKQECPVIPLVFQSVSRQALGAAHTKHFLFLHLT